MGIPFEFVLLLLVIVGIQGYILGRQRVSKQ
jgi:hypothetical protein